MVLKPIKRQKVWQQVEKQIKDLIINNKLKIGDKLPSEKELAEKLKVGRRSVREALHSLQKMGMIQIVQGKGSFLTAAKVDTYLETLATSISLKLLEEKDTLWELMEVRKILEAEVAFLSAERSSSQDLRLMRLSLNRQEEGIRRKNLELFNKGDLDFHNAIFRGCKNSILESIYSNLSTLMLDSRILTNKIPGVPEKSLKDHMNIYLAIKAKDPKKARNFMINHIRETEMNMRIMLEKKDF